VAAKNSLTQKNEGYVLVIFEVDTKHNLLNTVFAKTMNNFFKDIIQTKAEKRKKFVLMAELHYHANKSQPNHGAPVVRNMLFNTCPLHQRKYFWKCERCDEENKGKGKDTPVSPAPDNIGEQWDYGRCQGVLTK
jgi:hypothetical protein